MESIVDDNRGNLDCNWKTRICWIGTEIFIFEQITYGHPKSFTKIPNVQASDAMFTFRSHVAKYLHIPDIQMDASILREFYCQSEEDQSDHICNPDSLFSLFILVFMHHQILSNSISNSNIKGFVLCILRLFAMC